MINNKDNNLSNSNLKKQKVLSISNIRVLLGILIPLVAIFFILNIPLMLFRISLFKQQYIAIIWALVTALLFLCLPAKKNNPKYNPQWYDLLLVGLALITGAYIVIYYPTLVMEMGIIRPIQVYFGIITTILILEAVRRTTGLSIVSVVVIFILYARYGYLLSGLLASRTLSWSRLFQQLYLGSDFMLGSALYIATGTIFGFVFFGRVFMSLGATDFFMDLCFSLFGKVRGGPAKVAIVGSSMFGAISGSAVANVAATGMITIPLMKKTGYSKTFAAAVEAVASTGGQICPPVMGAAAFVMAEFLGIPYFKVVITAIIPTILYYFSLFVQVDGEAIKHSLGGAPKELIKPFWGTLKKGWFYIIPILALVWSLFIAFQNAGVAALTGIATAILLSLLNNKTRSFWSLKYIINLLIDVSESMFEIISVCAGAGLIIGIFAYTGLGLSFSQLLTQIAGGSILILALLTALASVILGMGMPTTPAYIMLAVLAAPAMVRIGIEPIIAHMFIFYFGTLSMITPPVALATYVASSISGTDSFVKTAWQGIQLAFAGYVVPFIFLYNPSLALVSGTTLEKLVAILFSTVAIYLLAITFSGYAINYKLKTVEKLFLFVLGFVLIFPNQQMSSQFIMNLKIIGLALASLFIFYLIRSHEGKEKRLLITKTNSVL